MVNGYVLLITHDMAVITRVPAKHKEEVLYKLAVLGVDGFNNPITEEERKRIMDAYENNA